MKKKELIKLIKTKSQEVEIKNFSSSILERVKNLPQIETIEAPKRVFKLKPVLFVTLGTLASVLLLMVLYNPASPIIPTDPITPTLENMDQVIALSTVSTVSLIDLVDTEIQASENYILKYGNEQESYRIDEELPDVTKYMETIEKLFSSQSDFGIEKQTISNGNFNNRMLFKTKDLMNEEANYKFDYNQTALANPKHFELNGELEIGEKQYHISGVAKTDVNELSLKAEKDIANYITIDYELIGTTHQFIFETIKDNESIQKVSFQLERSEEDQLIKLEFIEGESIGSYEFKIEVEDNVKVIKSRYNITTNDVEEKGEFVVRVITLQNQTKYSVLIKPEGRTPYVIQQGRVMTERRPRFQTSLEHYNF